MNESEILIIGSTGQLGTALRAKYPRAIATSSDDLDITNPAAMRSFDWSGISTIINAAAYTNVDEAETLEGRRAAWKVNGIGVRNIAEVALQHNLVLVHLSSDYVFDGTEEHTEDELYSPLGVYGQSKAAGDIAVSLVPKHYILRTTWVIGEGKNFVRTMIGLGQKDISPTVVADQIGRLTFTSELVRIIDHLFSTQATYGTYNATNEGEPASWSDITREIFKLGNFDLTVTDTTTAEYFASKPESAPRPLNSIMDLGKLHATGFRSRVWQEDLKAYVEKELRK